MLVVFVSYVASARRCSALFDILAPSYVTRSALQAGPLRARPDRLIPHFLHTTWPACTLRYTMLTR